MNPWWKKAEIKASTHELPVGSKKKRFESGWGKNRGRKSRGMTMLEIEKVSASLLPSSSLLTSKYQTTSSIIDRESGSWSAMNGLYSSVRNASHTHTPSNILPLMFFHDPSHWTQESRSGQLINHLRGIWIVWSAYRFPVYLLLWSPLLQTQKHWQGGPRERELVTEERLVVSTIGSVVCILADCYCRYWQYQEVEQERRGQVMPFHLPCLACRIHSQPSYIIILRNRDEEDHVDSI